MKDNVLVCCIEHGKQSVLYRVRAPVIFAAILEALQLYKSSILLLNLGFETNCAFGLPY